MWFSTMNHIGKYDELHKLWNKLLEIIKEDGIMERYIRVPPEEEIMITELFKINN
jgi:effector-binding domain-containing protein